MFIRSKIQFFESKSQQIIRHFFINKSCLSDQRYNFLKANHNCRRKYRLFTSVVYQIKDTIFWKQITTDFLKLYHRTGLFIRSKIQFFESKSQQANNHIHEVSGCLSDQRYNFLKANHNPSNRWLQNTGVVYQIKDTIFWKQITTKRSRHSNQSGLFIRSKIQFFESKSQRCRWFVNMRSRCLSDQRYNFLKANHNYYLRFNR